MAGSWQNRIVGEGMEAPDQLLANPKNWRLHPEAQQKGLAAILDRVGWVLPVLVNKRTGNLVDGHLRVALALRRGEPAIPVSYVDLDPEEEALILATLDPLAGMAATDRELLDVLLRENGGQDVELQALLDSIAQAEGLNLPPPPSLDELADKHGDPDEDAFWPVVKLKLPRDVAERFAAYLAKAPFVEDWRRLDWLMDRVRVEP